MNTDNYDILANYEEPYHSYLVQIRTLIYTIAAENKDIGEITESLKWGQPTYSTLKSKSGTPIRMDRLNDQVAIYFHCQTSLIENFRELFANDLQFLNNRAILLNPLEPLPLNEIRFCLSSALLYHKQNIKKHGL